MSLPRKWSSMGHLPKRHATCAGRPSLIQQFCGDGVTWLTASLTCRTQIGFCLIAILIGSYWVPGWWDASPDQASDEGAEQGFAATAGVMHELKETEIQR